MRNVTKPQLLQKTPFLRVFLPLLLFLLFFAAPISVSFIQNVATDDGALTLRENALDFSDKETLDYENRYVRGSVTLYYNQWIISDPFGEERDTIEGPVGPQYTFPLALPSRWTGEKPVGAEEALGPSGYASYRYLIRGLTPGRKVQAYRNVDIPNRIYLNGILSSSSGTPTMSSQTVVVSLSETYSAFVEVPESGELEYVIEVGNSGDGGVLHIGTVYYEGTFVFDFPARIGASIIIGAGIGMLVLVAGLIALSPERREAGILFAIASCGFGAYLFSADSLFAAVPFAFSLPLGDMLTLVMLGMGCFLAMVFSSSRPGHAFHLAEYLVTAAVGAVLLTLYTFMHSTNFAPIIVSLFALWPLYFFLRSAFVFVHGKGVAPPVWISALLAGFSVMFALYSFDIFGKRFVYYPAAFALSVIILALSLGFYGAYRHALRLRDEALLQRRYRNISARAQARMASEQTTLRVLAHIGESYERSISIGDRQLISFSSYLRQRLLALREDAIPFSEECDLEAKGIYFHNLTTDHPVELMLDYESGSMMVPPLFFSVPVLQLGERLEGEETLILCEDKRHVSLLYPSRLKLGELLIARMRERAEMLNLRLDEKPGSLSLYRARKKR